MPHIRVAHRAAPVRPAVTQRLENRLRPVAPRLLPILQPPIFSIQSNSINEDEEQQQQQTEKINHTTKIGHANRKKTTQQKSIQVPRYVLQQNGAKQPSLYLSNRPIRYAQPKYLGNLYAAR